MSKWMACGVVVLGLGCLDLAAQTGEPRTLWELLRRNHDRNGDGKITAQEYNRGAQKFARHDRNGDGVLTKEDFERRARGGGPRRRGGAGHAAMAASILARVVDADRSGDVPEREWKSFLTSVSTGDVVPRQKFTDAVVCGDDRARMRGRLLVRMLFRDRDRITLQDLKKLHARLDRNRNGAVEKGEMPRAARPGGRGRAADAHLPKPGDVAPDFALPRLENRQQLVKLSSFAGRRPVALIFGSYT